MAQRFREQRPPTQPGMIGNPLVGNGSVQPGGLGNSPGSMVGVGSVIGDGSGSPSSPLTKKRPLSGGADSGGPGSAGGNAGRQDGAGGAVTASPTAQTRGLDNGAGLGAGMLNGAGTGKAGSPQMNNAQPNNKSPVIGEWTGVN